MPLLPIDLQTMFNQMSQVGREAAVQREVSTQYQFLQGTEIVRKTEQDDRAVGQTRELGEGLEKVKEQRQRQGRRQGRPKLELPRALPVRLHFWIRMDPFAEGGSGWRYVLGGAVLIGCAAGLLKESLWGER